MTEKEKISNALCTFFSDDFMRVTTIRYTDKTKKYFVVGREHDPYIELKDQPEIPITMTDFFYEADEAARKWIEAGPRFVGTDEPFEQTEEGRIREKYCFIFPKDFLRDVEIDYSSEIKRYFVIGREYDSDLDRDEEKIPIAMTDSFYEAEKEAWKWIEAGPRLDAGSRPA